VLNSLLGILLFAGYLEYRILVLMTIAAFHSGAEFWFSGLFGFLIDLSPECILC